MVYAQGRQIDRFGLHAEVVLMDFVIKIGKNEAKLPAALLQRQGLDLKDEGVNSNTSVKEIFKAQWRGDRITVLDHRGGEEVTLIETDEEVSLSWARNKLTALVQWVQELGEHLDRKEGWMFAKSDLPEVMSRVEFIQERRDHLLDILVICHQEAMSAYYERVDRINAKLQAVLEAELAAADAQVRAEHRTADGVTAQTRERYQTLSGQLNSLPHFISDLRSRFPSVSKLETGFLFSNTTPKELPSVLATLQGNTEAVQALVESEQAEQGQAYATAIRNGISLMGETIREKIVDISDQLYGEIAYCLSTLEGLGDTRKFGPKVKISIDVHIERIGVLERLLSGFQSLQEGSGPLSHADLIARVQDFQIAFDTDARQGSGIGNGREALLAQLQKYRLDLDAVILGANLNSLGDGQAALLNWIDSGLESQQPAEAPITHRGEALSELTVMI